MDLLTLPIEILVHILSFVDWNELINVKLTNKKFYSIIKKYYNKLQKLKVNELFIENGNDEEDDINKIRITYSIYKNNVYNSRERKIRKFKVFYFDSTSLYKFTNFLNQIDVTYLKLINVSLDKYTKVIKILSDYYLKPINVKNVYININNNQDNTENIEDILQLLNKTQNVEYLALKFNFPFQYISTKLTIPIVKTLKSLVLHEKKNTSFVNKKMIKYIVKNNPELDDFHFSLNNSLIYPKIIEIIVKEQLSRENFDCHHKSIYLSFGVSNFNTHYRLLTYINSGSLPYRNTTVPTSRMDNDIGVILYSGKLQCTLCKKFDSIKIHERKLY
uniref:F-box domain-containing protein n=1 Tax=Strongyloides stercoralis TaxID=6248 RepID=A0A0K0EQA4_STRER